MGYYTKYTLRILNENDFLIETLRNENAKAFHALLSNGEPSHESKWYEHEEVLKMFSLKFPNVIFELKGEGEENGAYWVKYFMNGKMQHGQASIVYEPFDKELFL